jgi:hypothetical protein
MQIETIVLYHRDGQRMREVDLRPGQLNVITGVSQTGKSALIEVVDYVLGSDRHGVFRGPITATVGWYALRLRIAGTSVLVARQAPEPNRQASSAAALRVGLETPPAPDELVANTNVEAMTARLGDLLGIEDNEQPRPEAVSQGPLRATLRHALAYVFQRQQQIASPDVLFSGQSERFNALAIRDTLPYFLGAVDHDALDQRRQLTARRRELRELDRLVSTAERDRLDLVGRVATLQAEARAVGLVDADDVQDGTGLPALAQIAQREIGDAAPAGGELEVLDALRDRRATAAEALREVRVERRVLARRVREANEFDGETAEQRARLTSLGLLPDPTERNETICPACDAVHEESDPTVGDLRAALTQADARLAGVRQDAPRLDRAIAALDEREQALRTELNVAQVELDRLVARSELARRSRDRLVARSYLQGRIATFLEEHPPFDDAQLAALRAERDRARTRVERLEEVLSADSTRARTDTALGIIGGDMTRMAGQLDLGYIGEGVRLDPVRLTVVSDHLDGPVWLGEGMGSGANWLGYHLVTLLAMHRWFVERDRPVPRLLMLDQPTQVFFPSDRRTADRSVNDLPDDDRRRVRELFELLAQVVGDLDGRLQVVVTDHADLDEPWFAQAVVEDWRDGRALIPADWLDDVSGD